MDRNQAARRAALRTLLLGTAGVAVAGCGGSNEPAGGGAPASGGAPAAGTTPPPAPAASPAPAAAPAGGAPAPAAAPAGGAAVDPQEPQAKALNYVLDASQVDRQRHPNYQPGQRCANCIHYQGPETATQAPCAIFAGRAVVGPGWCQVWAKKA